MTIEYQTTKTRGGAAVRIYCRDGGGNYPIHGAMWIPDLREWEPSKWTKDGRFFSTLAVDSYNDLVEGI